MKEMINTSFGPSKSFVKVFMCFSTLYSALPHNLINDKLVDLTSRMFT